MIIDTTLAPAPEETPSATSTAPGTTLDPRDVWLDAMQVCARYGWGSTQGRAKLKDPGSPGPSTAGGGWTSCTRTRKP